VGTDCELAEVSQGIKHPVPHAAADKLGTRPVKGERFNHPIGCARLDPQALSQTAYPLPMQAVDHEAVMLNGRGIQALDQVVQYTAWHHLHGVGKAVLLIHR